MPNVIPTHLDLLVDFGRSDLLDLNAFETPGLYDWMEYALCSQVDPELFFPQHQGSKTCNEAKKICARCPVVSQCLEQALRVPAMDDFGVWGNTAPPEREEIRRQRRAAGIELIEFDSLDIEPAIDLTVDDDYAEVA